MEKVTTFLKEHKTKVILVVTLIVALVIYKKTKK
jgi:hypothetical protein